MRRDVIPLTLPGPKLQLHFCPLCVVALSVVGYSTEQDTTLPIVDFSWFGFTHALYRRFLIPTCNYSRKAVLTINESLIAGHFEFMIKGLNWGPQIE